MKVYVYEQGCRYEGGAFKAVFYTKEAAIAQIKKDIDANEYYKDEKITISERPNNVWCAQTDYEFWHVFECEVQE